MIDLLFELAWKSGVCAGATLLLLRLFRSRSAAEKSVVAQLGLLALILLPLGALALPAVEMAAPAAIAEALPFSPAAVDTGAPAAALPASAASAPLDRAIIAAFLYAAPALLLLLGLAVAVGRLQRIRARADVVVDPRWLAALAAAQRRLQLKHGTALLTSGEINSPVSWGVLRPIIIVDAAAAADTARAEAIIAHELAHVVRLDWLKLLAGRVAIALFWFNPLVWMLARQSHQLCEEAADDAVLRSQVPSADYADLLLGSVRHANRGSLLAANGVAPSRSSLSRRIAHVLDPSRPRGTARAGWAAASLASALCINAALAAAEPVVRAPLSIDASAGETAAAALSRLDSHHARTIGKAIAAADWSARRVEGDTTFSHPAAIGPLVAALGDDSPTVRRLAVWGLSEMRPTVGDAAAAPVARLLADPAPEVRGEAARALGDFGSADYASEIAQLMKDPDPRVRVQAAHALGDLRSPATRPALEAAISDPDPGVRGKAAWALRQVAEAEEILERYGGG